MKPLSKLKLTWSLFRLCGVHLWSFTQEVLKIRIYKINMTNTRVKLRQHPQCQCIKAWWRHQMETFSVLLAHCMGNSPVTGKFPTKKPVTRSFDVSFDVCLYKRLSKQSRGWWFEAPSRPLWHFHNGITTWDVLHGREKVEWSDCIMNENNTTTYRAVWWHGSSLADLCHNGSQSIKRDSLDVRHLKHLFSRFHLTFGCMVA